MTRHADNDSTGSEATGGTTVDAPFTRRGVLRTAGTATAGALALGATGGTAAAGDIDCEACVRFGKVEGQPSVGDRYRFEYGSYTVVVRVLDVRYEDGEAVAFQWQVTDEADYRPVCRVEVKGGPRTETRTYDGAWSAWAAAPAHLRNRNRTRFAISNVTVSVCVPESAVEEGEATGSGGPPPGRGPDGDRGRGGNRGRGRGSNRGGGGGPR